jgi:hypothetical protein
MNRNPALEAAFGDVSFLDHAPAEAPGTQAIEVDDAAAQPFPRWVIPGAAGGLVEHGAKAFQVDEAMLGPLVLGALFGAVGNSRVVRLTNSWTEPAVGWFVVVAPSGAGKSPALECVMRPLQAHDAALHAAWVYECEVAEEEGVNKKPLCERLVTADSTFEGLCSMLGNSARGMVLVADELAGWLGGFTRYSGGGRAASEEARWLPMHGARSLQVDRKGSGPLRIDRASLSIVGGVQPGVLSKALGQTDFESGLVARLCLSLPAVRTRVWDRKLELPAGLEDAYAAQVNDLLSLQAVPRNGRLEPVALVWDAQAEREWAAHHRWVNELAARSDDRERAALSKLEGMAARFALVLHLARRAAGEGIDPGTIDAESMRRGAVLVKWFWTEAQRVYEVLTEGAAGADQLTLVEWIKAQGGQTSVREMQRGPRQFRVDADRAERLLSDLVAEGFGRWVMDDHGGGRGRPVARFVLFTGGGGDAGDSDGNR